MRKLRNGKVFRDVHVELPAELHRRLEIEKTRQGRSFASILYEWLQPHLESLPSSPPEHAPAMT